MFRNKTYAKIMLVLAIVCACVLCGIIFINTKGMTSEEFVKTFLDSFIFTFINGNGWKDIGNGLLITLKISVIAVIVGSVAGVYFSRLLRHKVNIIAKTTSFVNYLIDGYPALVLIIIMRNIIFSKSVDILYICIIGISLDFANGLAVLFNVGVAAIDKGEIETAISMGYSDLQIFWKIIFPQVVTLMFSQYSNLVVALIKGSSVVGYFEIMDLTKVSEMLTDGISNKYFTLIITTILYFIVAKTMVWLLGIIAKKLDPTRKKRMIKGVIVKQEDGKEMIAKND